MLQEFEPLPSGQACGSILRNRRKQLDLTIEELALQLGYSARLVGEVERGVRSVSFEKTCRIAHALGIDLYCKIR